MAVLVLVLVLVLDLDPDSRLAPVSMTSDMSICTLALVSFPSSHSSCCSRREIIISLFLGGNINNTER